MSAYQNGASAGREGREPNPPTYNNFIDPLFGVSKERAEKRNEDYKQGYSAGSQQRTADALEDDDD